MPVLPPPPEPDAPPAIAGWQVRMMAETDSTQQAAAGSPVWSAVVAGIQTRGRGQRERVFTSDRGGLYLTAVVPYDGEMARWRGFALAVGKAVRQALLDQGIGDLRLRWPNDLMVGARKVGGLLVEQDGPESLLVGLGLNVTNRPWLEDHTLRYAAGRLLDHSDRALTGPAQLVAPMLRAIRFAHEEFSVQRLTGLVTAINRCWGPRRHVWLEAVPEVELVASEGAFAGIGDTGHVLLVRPDGSITSVPEHHIQRLVEVE